MIASLIFIDVNVFMYAAGASHHYKAPCVRILSDIETGALTATINTEILQELLYRYSHIILADKGIQLCRDILRYPLTVLPVAEMILGWQLICFRLIMPLASNREMRFTRRRCRTMASRD